MALEIYTFFYDDRLFKWLAKDSVIDQHIKFKIHEILNKIVTLLNSQLMSSGTKLSDMPRMITRLSFALRNCLGYQKSLAKGLISYV